MKFDLEKAIQQWRKGLHGHEGFEDAAVEELEDHLRSCIEDKMGNGLSGRQAFEETIYEQFRGIDNLSASFQAYSKRKTYPLSTTLNHFKTAARFLAKNRSLSTLNVLGLAVGIAAFLLINTFVFNELNYDLFHSKKDRIFRISQKFFRNGTLDYHGAATFPRVGPALKAEFPEVQDQCRIFKKYAPGTVRFEDKAFREENLYYADPSFFEIFDYTLLSGNRAQALTEPNTALIDERTARKYFGDANPLGRRIEVGSADGLESFEIVGVLKTITNSHLKFAFIFPFQNYVAIYPEAENIWGWNDFYTYLLMDQNTDLRTFEEQLPSFADRHGGERRGSSYVGFGLQPLEDLYLHSDLTYEPHVNGNFELIKLLAIISVLILLVAWVNYVNLYTARSIQRSKEIGIRKVMGSSRRQLIWQFLAEALLVNGLSVVLGLGLFLLAIPWFNEISDLVVDASILLQWKTILVILFLWLMGGLVSGYYPASTLSNFQTIPALKGLVKTTGKGVIIRRVLIIAQFTVSAALISCTLIIQKQIDFLESQGIQIDTDNLMVVRSPDAIPDQEKHFQDLATFKKQLLAHHQIDLVAVASEVPGKPVSWWGGTIRQGASLKDRTTVYRIGTDEHYTGLYGDIIAAGRALRSTDHRKVLINEEACKKLGFESAEAAINDHIITSYDTLMVVGVVKNYHQETLKSSFKPTLFIFPEASELKFVNIRFRDMDKELLSYIKNEYQTIFAGAAFDHFFISDWVKDQMESDQSFFRTFGLFSGIAIFIALMGLVGLSSYFVLQRTKEVCIRKILGSGEGKLFTQLSSELVKHILLANIISVPLILAFSHYWLGQFAYQISIPWFVFPFTVLVTLMLGVLTITKSILGVIRLNPLEKLRFE